MAVMIKGADYPTTLPTRYKLNKGQLCKLFSLAVPFDFQILEEFSELEEAIRVVWRGQIFRVGPTLNVESQSGRMLVSDNESILMQTLLLTKYYEIITVNGEQENQLHVLSEPAAKYVMILPGEEPKKEWKDMTLIEQLNESVRGAYPIFNDTVNGGKYALVPLIQDNQFIRIYDPYENAARGERRLKITHTAYDNIVGNIYYPEPKDLPELAKYLLHSKTITNKESVQVLIREKSSEVYSMSFNADMQNLFEKQEGAEG
jgi:hypothetical protein